MSHVIYYAKRQIKQIIEKSLDKLLRFESFQDYINRRYKRDGFTIVADRFLEGLYYSYKGFKFCLVEDLVSITTVSNEYRLNDIKEDDIVLDIGANIGAFSILASKKAKHVYAVEPLSADILRKNIAINQINNITVLETGLGTSKQNVRYKRRQKIIELIPLNKILEITGKCDFLKMDCEGGEWCINYHDLEGFRQIECELHNFDGKHDFHIFEKMLIKAGFEYELDVDNSEIKFCFIHSIKSINSPSKKIMHENNKR